MDRNSEKQAVKEAIEKFFRAMDEQDIELFEESQGRDESVIHIGTDKGERWDGWTELKYDTYNQFEGMTSFKVDVSNQRIELAQNGDTAWFAQDQDMRIGKTDGSEIHLENARFTGVLEKRGGHWSMVQSHLSVPDS